MLQEFRRRLCGRQDHALGSGAIAQPDDRARRLADRNAQGDRQYRQAGCGQLPQLSVDCARRRRYHGDETDQCLCGARQPRPRGQADDHRLRPGPQRQGDLSHGQSLPGDGRVQCARLERPGDAAAAGSRQAVDRTAGRLPDGPYPRRRGRTRHRDRAARPRPPTVRQDRNDLGSDQRVVRRRNARRRRRCLSRL